MSVEWGRAAGQAGRQAGRDGGEEPLSATPGVVRNRGRANPGPAASGDPLRGQSQAVAPPATPQHPAGNKAEATLRHTQAPSAGSPRVLSGAGAAPGHEVWPCWGCPLKERCSAPSSPAARSGHLRAAASAYLRTGARGSALGSPTAREEAPPLAHAHSRPGASTARPRAPRLDSGPAPVQFVSGRESQSGRWKGQH